MGRKLKFAIVVAAACFGAILIAGQTWEQLLANMDEHCVLGFFPNSESGKLVPYLRIEVSDDLAPEDVVVEVARGEFIEPHSISQVEWFDDEIFHQLDYFSEKLTEAKYGISVTFLHSKRAQTFAYSPSPLKYEYQIEYRCYDPTT